MVSFAGEMKISDTMVEHTLAHSFRGQALPSPGRGLSLPALVNQLPGSLEWAVLFRTQALVELISADQLGNMLGLRSGTGIAESVCVALTSAGKCLAFDAEGPWLWSLGGPLPDSEVDTE